MHGAGAFAAQRAAPFLIDEHVYEGVAVASRAESVRRRDGPLAQHEQHAGTGSAGFHDLTPRQRQILQLIAEGHGTRRIAERLSVGVKTIETHRAGLMQRLRIYDIAGLVRFAIRNGLLPP